MRLTHGNFGGASLEAIKIQETENSDQPAVKADEGFSFKLLSIIVGVHAFALVGIAFFYSPRALIALACAHTFFALFGVALGYHRYFSHLSFVPKPWFRRFLAVTSTLCFQGGPIFWAATHRAHHQKTEKHGDPYSAGRGFLWSHFLWLFHLRPNGFSLSRIPRLAPDLLRDPYLLFIEKNAIALNVGVLILGAIAAWSVGCFDLFMWAFPVRIVTIWHATWMTNSFYHGARFKGASEPTGLRNNIIGDLLLGGEGSHRNHHERPALLINRERWYHFDLAGFVVILLTKIGVVESYRK